MSNLEGVKPSNRANVIVAQTMEHLLSSVLHLSDGGPKQVDRKCCGGLHSRRRNYKITTNKFIKFWTWKHLSGQLLFLQWIWNCFRLQKRHEDVVFWNYHNEICYFSLPHQSWDGERVPYSSHKLIKIPAPKTGRSNGTY